MPDIKTEIIYGGKLGLFKYSFPYIMKDPELKKEFVLTFQNEIGFNILVLIVKNKKEAEELIMNKFKIESMDELFRENYNVEFMEIKNKNYKW